MDTSKRRTAITSVMVRFHDTRSGRAELRMAAHIAAALDLPLDVFAACPSAVLAIAARAPDVHDAGRGEITRVTNRTKAIVDTDTVLRVRMAPMNWVRFGFPSDALVVDAMFAGTHRNITVLDGTGNDTFPGTVDAPIFVPLGDGESGIHAAKFATMLAADLRRPLILYHTTWKNPDVVSDRPADHICTSAGNVIMIARTRVQALGVTPTVCIETAPVVAGGIIRAAIRERAACIVVARSGKTGKGSYVDQLRSQSPIPVLIVATPTTSPEGP